ncbi:MAG: hypothetical protein GXO55_02530 [Chloroflexi bacterium]|nr:hypothetical protein [Chloroflexota bacterium]
MTGLQWFLSVAGQGLAFLPLTFALLKMWVRAEEDEYLALTLGFAWPVGMAVLGYLAWLGMLVHVSLFHPRVLWGITLLLGAAAWALWGRSVARALRDHLRVVVEMGGVALVLLGIWWVLRVAGNPEFIPLGEHIMNISFTQSVIRYPTLPPLNPFLAGFTLDFYYYFFALFIGLNAVMSGVSLPIAYFYLGIFWPVLIGLGIYAVLYTVGRARLTPYLGVFLYGLIGNWGIFLQLAAEAGLLSRTLLQQFGLIGTLRVTGTWHFPPVSNLWWVAPTRILPDKNPLPYAITEFPFFSFIIGDLHPHVMVIPWSLLALFVATKGELRGWRPLVGMAFLLGLIPLINSWSIIPILMVLGLRVLRDARPVRAAVRVGILLVLSVGLFLPYHLHLQNPILAYRVHVFNTSLLSWGMHWGPFLLPVLLGVAMTMKEGKRRWMGGILGGALVLGSLLRFEIGLPLVVWSAWVLWIFWRDREDVALLWVLVWSLMNVMVEVFYLEDFFGGRYNTVFKSYEEAWMLIALAAALLLERIPGWKRKLALIWASVGVVYVVAVFLMVAPHVSLAFQGVNDRWLPDHLYEEHKLHVSQSLADHGVERVIEAKTAYPIPSVMAGLIEVAQRDPVLLQWYVKRMNAVGERLTARDRFFQTRDVPTRGALIQDLGVDAILVGNEERWLYGYDLDVSLSRLAVPGLSSGNVIAYRPGDVRVCADETPALSFRGEGGHVGLRALRVVRGQNFADKPVLAVFEVWDHEGGDLAQMAVFIHFLDAQGHVIAQADHSLGLWDTRWQDPATGRIYSVQWVEIPPDIHPAAIRLGVWIPATKERFRTDSGSDNVIIPLDGC